MQVQPAQRVRLATGALTILERSRRVCERKGARGGVDGGRIIARQHVALHRRPCSSTGWLELSAQECEVATTKYSQ